MKVLIFGLSGSGKTTLAKELAYHFQWDNEFVFNYVLDSGLVEARDFDEFYTITD